MSDAASAAGAAGPSSATSQESQAQSTAGESQTQGGSSNSKPDAEGRATERTTERERSDSPDVKETSQRKAAPKSDKPAPSNPYAGTKHKIKSDGKELELEYEELVRRASHATAANTRMQRAAAVEKQAKAVESFINGDPIPLIEIAGIDAVEALSEEILRNRIDWDELSEEEREARLLRHENEQLKSEKQQREEREAAQRKAQVEAQEFERLESEICEAIEKLGKKPTPRMVVRATEYLLANLEARDGQKMSGSEAFEKTRADLMLEIPEFLDGMPATEVVKILPKSVLAGLQKHFVDQALAQDPFRSGRVELSDEPTHKTSTPPQRLKTDDWFAAKERQFGGK